MLLYLLQEASRMAMFQLQMFIATFGFLGIAVVISLCIGVPMFITRPWRD
jgi:predicted transporter